MSVQVFNSILPFSIDRFMALLPDGCAQLLRFRIVGIDVGNKNCQQLGSRSECRRAFGPRTRAGQHDVCVAKMHLCPADWIAVAVVLSEAEDLRQPLAGIRYAALNDMGKKNAGGNGAVLHGDSMQLFRMLGNRSVSCECEILATLETPCREKQEIGSAGRRSCGP
jgi:hypothetical protein